MKINVTLRQALRLYELAKEANDVDLCNIADRVIGPKTCTSCGMVNEAVTAVRPKERLCRACYNGGINLEDRM